MTCRRVSQLLIAAFVLLSASAWSHESASQVVGQMTITVACVPHKEAEKMLTEQHREDLRLMGVTNDSGVLMELWSDGKGGTWSLILRRTAPANVRCLVASGNGLADTKNFIERGLAK